MAIRFRTLAAAPLIVPLALHIGASEAFLSSGSLVQNQVRPSTWS